MRNNFIRIPANLIGLAKAAAGPAGGTGRPTGTSTGTGGGTGQTSGVTSEESTTRGIVDSVAGVSNRGRSSYVPGSFEEAKDKLDGMYNDPNLDPKQLEKQQEQVSKLEGDRRNDAIWRQSADNTNDDSIDWRPVDWDNSGLSGNLTVVRGTRLTPAQYGYYQRKVKEYGGDRNKAWQDVQSKLNANQGQYQMWVQTDEDKALQEQNRRALSQPPSGGQWYRSYGDDAQLGPGNTIRVKGAPSPALQRSAQARGMTIVSDTRYYGNQGNWTRAADARRAAQYQNRVNAQQYNHVPQPQNNRGRVAPLGGWGDKNFDPRLVSNLESLASSNSATPMISYLVRNAGQIHNWLNDNYTTPTGQKVIDALFNYSGVMNDVKGSWAKMTPEQQLQLKRDAAYTVLKSYFGNSLWSSEGQRPTESMAGMPVGANFAGAAIRGRN